MNFTIAVVFYRNFKFNMNKFYYSLRNVRTYKNQVLIMFGTLMQEKQIQFNKDQSKRIN